MKCSFALKTFLIDPSAVVGFSMGQWDALIQEAYAAGMLGRVAWLLEARQLTDAIPAQARWHFESVTKVFQAHAHDIEQEIIEIRNALKPAGIVPVLLKGSAYLEKQDAPYGGRMFSDVDIFVPEAQLKGAEDLLRWSGWLTEKLDDYDTQFYRRWMHELPPMFHKKRGISLDLHHSLLPKTSRVSLNPDRLVVDQRRTGRNGVYTLCDEDKLLHSAAHLLLEGEFDHGYRDLSDLDLLFRQYALQGEPFWQSLGKRAEDLGLGRVLYYACRYCRLLLNSPVPDEVVVRLEKYAPGFALRQLMDSLFTRALLPTHPHCEDRLSGLARWLLYVRSHWLKMPLWILLPHLFHKAFITPFNRKDSTADDAL